MKRIIALIFASVITLTITAAGQSLDQKADSAYNAGDYAAASRLYNEAIKHDGPSASLYYNLGDSYYRQGKTAQAVISFERSLRLDPGNNDARANLDFVNSKLIDKKGYEGSFLSRTFHDITCIMSSNAWALLALALFILAVGSAALYLFSTSVPLRKIGFFGGGIVAVLCLLCIVVSFNGRRIMLAKNVAIVTAKSTILSTAPHQPQNRNEEAMLLHEGARVVLLDSVVSPVDSIKVKWYDAQFDNEHRAWINGNDIEAI